MKVRCACERSFEVDVNAAGKRFRCPHCGRYITLPATVLAEIRRNSLISLGQPATTSTIVVRTGENESAPNFLIWTAGVVAATTIVAVALLAMSLGPSNRASTSQYETTDPSLVTTKATMTSTTGDPSLVSDSAPVLAQDFYRGKSPIEMTESEWIMTLRDWGELPNWWMNWPYSDAHPWSYPLQNQIAFFREVREMDHSDHISDAKLERLRKDFLSKHHDYEPYPANSPSNAVDQYVNAARTALSRDLMQQQLNEAARLLRSMLLRPANPIQSQSATQPIEVTTQR